MVDTSRPSPLYLSSLYGVVSLSLSLSLLLAGIHNQWQDNRRTLGRVLLAVPYRDSPLMGGPDVSRTYTFSESSYCRGTNFEHGGIREVE